MKYLIFLLLSLCAIENATAHTIKVAVLDTGLSLGNLIKDEAPLCEPVHNLANEATDATLHGTNVVSIIAFEASKSNYCFVIYKVFNGLKIDMLAYKSALRDIYLRSDIDIVNLSLAGYYEMREETSLLKSILDQGVIIVAAAGNNSQDLGLWCNVYPACADPRIIVVGNRNVKSSNFGTPIDVLENGFDVLGAGVHLTGTSQAAAIHTGKLIFKLNQKLGAAK